MTDKLEKEEMLSEEIFEIVQKDFEELSSEDLERLSFMIGVILQERDQEGDV